MVKLLAKIGSLLWLFHGKKVRQWKRLRIESWLYARKVRRIAKSVGPYITIHKKSTVTKTTVIGNYSGLSDVHIYGGGDVIIGNHTFVSEGTVIYSQNHNYDSDTLLPFGTDWTFKTVRIDDCVWVGSFCIILPGTHIGEGAIIQAGSVVHGEIPPCAIAGGNPAKVFAWRDKKHYEELKSAGRFAHC